MNVLSYKFIIQIQDTYHEENKKKTGKTVTHLYSKVTINILDHKDPLPRNNIPIDIAQVLKYELFLMFYV